MVTSRQKIGNQKLETGTGKLEMGSQKPGTIFGIRISIFGVLLLSAFCFLPCSFPQQPQAQSGQPLYPVNAKYVNGVAPGYWPTAGGGLTLNLSAGTALCGNPPAPVTYPGGTLTLAAGATSYVYLDPAANCAPASVVFLSPPAAPAPSQVAGGSLGARTYYVKTTYVNANGETSLSPEATFAVSADDLLQVASPPAVAGATGWNLYVSDSSGKEAIQNPDSPMAIGTAWTEPASGAPYLGGFPGPGSNSTGLQPGQIPLAKVITASGSFTSITDLRSWSVDPGSQAPVFRVNLMPGSDLGAKLAACIAQLPASGGTCDARELTGNQTISANPFANLAQFTSLTVLFGQGTITTVPLIMPSNIQQGIVIRGAGSNATLFTPSSANQPVFQGARAAGPDGSTCDQCFLGNFAVVANPSGSTGTAIDTTGFRDSTFEDIQYFDSSRGWLEGAGNWNSFFHSASYPTPDYLNRIIHPIIDGGGSPATVFLFDNGGTGNAGYNAQVTLIENPEIYGASNITTIFDLQHSGGVTIRGGLIEADPNAKILVPGTFTTFENVWIDTNAGATLISPQTDSSGSSNNVVFRNNWLATSGWNFTIPSWASDWMVAGNEPSAHLTVTDDGSNDFIQYGATVNSLKAIRAVITGTNTVTFSPTPTFDASLGNTQKITLTGNVTSATVSNTTAGEQLNFIICQDSTGGRTFAWPANVKGGMTVGATASKCSAQSFLFDGTNAYAQGPGSSNM
jgi:hypothetical protein